jgi:hypothetical protein
MNRYNYLEFLLSGNTIQEVGLAPDKKNIPIMVDGLLKALDDLSARVSDLDNMAKYINDNNLREKILPVILLTDNMSELRKGIRAIRDSIPIK